MRFNAALIASAVYNSSRVSAEVEPLSPYDFLPGFERDPEEEEKERLRRSIKQGIAYSFLALKGKSPEEIQAAKAKMVQGMTASGVEDPEGLIREVFPDL